MTPEQKPPSNPDNSQQYSGAQYGDIRDPARLDEGFSDALDAVESASASDNNEEDILDTPEFEASMAYLNLDTLLDRWMSFHPDARPEDVENALQTFWEAIIKRDGPSSSSRPE
ncbi:MAG: hypothetical protein ABIR37_00940 [Candidatus Saccharimonadales bacterium]